MADVLRERLACKAERFALIGDDRARSGRFVV